MNTIIDGGPSTSHPADLPGLSNAEAARRLAEFGANVLVPEGGRGSILRLAFALITDPMAILLIAAGITYWFLNDRLDATIALGALVPIFLVSAVLEQRSERALEQLKKMAAPVARVRRERTELSVEASWLFPETS